jgi:hypothetical protein
MAMQFNRHCEQSEAIQEGKASDGLLRPLAALRLLAMTVARVDLFAPCFKEWLVGAA